VWKDPYLTNQDRIDTNRKSTGARLTWDRILGSQFQMQYTYRKVDISSEKSGESIGSLSSSQRQLLERDSDLHNAEILYRFNFAKKHLLTPAFIYTLDDRDGKAMQNDAYTLQLTYAYRDNPLTGPYRVIS